MGITGFRSTPPAWPQLGTGADHQCQPLVVLETCTATRPRIGEETMSRVKLPGEHWHWSEVPSVKTMGALLCRVLRSIVHPSCVLLGSYTASPASTCNYRQF